MSKHRVIRSAASASLLGGILLTVGAAMAQTTAPTSPQTTTPPAQTPSDGVARGIVQPPRGVDPEMVTPPPADVKPSMPVIKPPTSTR